MIDDFLEFLVFSGLVTDEMVSNYGVYRIAKEFLKEYPQYMCIEFKNYINYCFIPQMKQNIRNAKLEQLENDFKIVV